MKNESSPLNKKIFKYSIQANGGDITVGTISADSVKSAVEVLFRIKDKTVTSFSIEEIYN